MIWYVPSLLLSYHSCSDGANVNTRRQCGGPARALGSDAEVASTPTSVVSLDLWRALHFLVLISEKT